MSFDLLGAGEGLAKEYITLRVKSVDVDKLSQKLGGAKGVAVSKAMPLIDSYPGVALNMALPFAKNLIRDDYGIELEYEVTDVAPPKQNSKSAYMSGLLVGLFLATTGVVGWKFFGK